MKRTYPIRAIGGKPRLLQQGNRHSFIENMVMQAAVIRVSTTARMEPFHRARQWIARKIMQAKDLIQMAEVGFVSPLLVVVQKMSKGGHRPAMIEGESAIGQHHEQHSARLQHPSPFLQHLQRVRAVLEYVRGQYEVIGRIFNRDLSGFANQRVLAVIGPNGRFAENAVIDSCNGVHGKEPARSKAGAGSAYLQALSTREGAKHFPVIRAPRRDEFVTDPS